MLSGRRPLVLLALFPALVLGAPAAAQAACGVPAAKAVYETPEVQVYTRAAETKGVRDLLACHRATGKARVVDVRANDGMGTDEFSVVNGVLGGRWIWTSLLSSAAESADARDDRLTDLRNGRTLSVDVEDEFTDATTLALPGVLLVADEKGLVARFTDGRVEQLATGPTTAPAANGARVYWRLNGVAQTTTLSLPTGDPARTRPRARTVRRCKPRTGARLILRTDAFVLTRTGGTSWVCRPARGRTFRLGAVEGLQPVSERHVAYTKPGLIGVFDAVRGSYRELQSTSGAVGAGLLAAGPGGLRAWAQTAPAATILSSEPAAEVALGGNVAYWLDASGAARSADVPS